MSIPARLLLALTLAVVLALLVGSAAVYGDLPARIPTHFNAAGTPDAFGAKSNWWLLPLVNVASTAITIGLAILLPRRPDLLNLPAKPEILALPRAAQEVVVRQAQPGLMLVGLIVAATMAWLQYSAWQVATGRGSGGLGNLVILLPVLLTLAIPAMLLPVMRELRRQQAALAQR